MDGNTKGKEEITLTETLLQTIIPQGAFACLFVWLLVTTNNKNEEREGKYQNTIDKNQEVIQAQASAFTSISKDITEIKHKIFEKKGDE